MVTLFKFFNSNPEDSTDFATASVCVSASVEHRDDQPNLDVIGPVNLRTHISA